MLDDQKTMSYRPVFKLVNNGAVNFKNFSQLIYPQNFNRSEKGSGVCKRFGPQSSVARLFFQNSVI